MTDYQITIGPTDGDTAAQLYRDVRDLGVRSDAVDIEEVDE